MDIDRSGIRTSLVCSAPLVAISSPGITLPLILIQCTFRFIYFYIYINYIIYICYIFFIYIYFIICIKFNHVIPVWCVNCLRSHFVSVFCSFHITLFYIFSKKLFIHLFKAAPSLFVFILYWTFGLVFVGVPQKYFSQFANFSD